MGKIELKKRQRLKAQRYALLLAFSVILAGCSDSQTVDSESKFQQESFRWGVELLDPSDADKFLPVGKISFNTPDIVIIGIRYKNLSETEVYFTSLPIGYDSIIKLIDVKTSASVTTYTEMGIQMRDLFQENILAEGSIRTLPLKPGESYVERVKLSDYFHIPSGDYYAVIERRSDEVIPQGEFRTLEFSIRE